MLLIINLFFIRWQNLYMLSMEILSLQEKNILKYVLTVYGNKEISKITGLSQHTVGTHIRHIFLKLNVHSRAELRVVLKHLPS
jgi:DNA-binding CsgD family transcriptional regulator